MEYGLLCGALPATACLLLPLAGWLAARPLLRFTCCLLPTPQFFGIASSTIYLDVLKKYILNVLYSIVLYSRTVIEYSTVQYSTVHASNL